jgi:hypothetical protein
MGHFATRRETRRFGALAATMPRPSLSLRWRFGYRLLDADATMRRPRPLSWPRDKEFSSYHVDLRDYAFRETLDAARSDAQATAHFAIFSPQRSAAAMLSHTSGWPRLSRARATAAATARR